MEQVTEVTGTLLSPSLVNVFRMLIDLNGGRTAPFAVVARRNGVVGTPPVRKVRAVVEGIAEVLQRCIADILNASRKLWRTHDDAELAYEIPLDAAACL